MESYFREDVLSGFQKSFLFGISHEDGWRWSQVVGVALALRLQGSSANMGQAGMS